MKPVEVEVRNKVAIVTINREERRNALSRDALEAFGALKSHLLTDETLRAIIVTGAGDKAFCAGADLKERAGMNEDEIRTQLTRYDEQLGWLDPAPIPVIAAINGVALGGGLELALMCDLRIASPNAVLGLTETRLGIIPGAGGTQRLPHLVGEAKAKEMILLGQRLSAEQALECGLVHRLAKAQASLLAETLDWIEPITSGAPIAQAAALEAIDSARHSPLAEGLKREQAAYERCLTSQDRLEALSAFREKRKPDFKGR